MFVSDAHLYVPREIRWSRVMAIRFSATRRRKSFARRLKRDLRASLPLLALAITFGMTMLTSEFATIMVPTGATQSPGAQQVQQNVARLFAPTDAEKAVDGRRAEPKRAVPVVASSIIRANVAMLD